MILHQSYYSFLPSSVIGIVLLDPAAVHVATSSESQLVHSFSTARAVASSAPVTRCLSWCCTVSPAVPEHAVLSLGIFSLHSGIDQSYIVVIYCSMFTTTETMRAFKRDTGIIESSELYLRQSSALPMQPDFAVSALDHVDAACLVTYKTEHVTFLLSSDFEIMC